MSVGTPEVVKLLEHYLELAKTQPWASVAVVLTGQAGQGHPDVGDGTWAGEIRLERSTLEALGLLQDRLAQNIACWMRPPQDPSLDASYVCYPVSHGPLGYDYMVWLIDAEMTRVREGAPAPLKVGFWCGRDAERRMHSDRRRMWLDNVFRPMLPMIGAVEDERAIYGHCKEVYVPRDIVAAYHRGEKVPKLKPRIPVPYHGAVTITLREAEHGATRNSRVSDWLQFADWVQARVPAVIIVRDTAKADDPVPGFSTSPRASRDLDYRFALYEGAAINLFVSNGPCGFAFFGSRPGLVFAEPPTGDGSGEFWNTPEHWHECHGIKVGEQFPWCRKDQRYVWKADTYENIVAAWNETMAQARAA